MKYILKKSKPALVFEIFLPKRMAYASKLAEVMDAFIADDSVLDIPAVRRITSREPDNKAKHGRFAKRIRDVISGYSLYEVDGRFSSDKGPVDERTWVIRLIMHDPKAEAGMRAKFRSFASAIVRHLIGQRFAEELGTEDEVWILQYNQANLTRWVKSE